MRLPRTVHDLGFRRRQGERKIRRSPAIGYERTGFISNVGVTRTNLSMTWLQMAQQQGRDDQLSYA